MKMAELGHNIEVVAPYDIEVENTTFERIKLHRFKYIWPQNLHLLGHARALRGDVTLRISAYLLLPLYLISSYITLRRIVRQQKSEFIHAHWLVPSGFVAAILSRVMKIPLAISLHGSDIFVVSRNKIFSYLSRWILKQASVVTACSDHLNQKAQELGALDKVIVMPWGVDPESFHPGRKSIESRHKFGWDEGTFIIGSLGRMVEKKGFNVLVRSMPEVLAKLPDCQLVIGGEGPLRRKLQMKVKALGLDESIHFPGKIAWNDVPDFLANMNLFVLPSITDPYGNVDGLPTVLLEAMSSGTPVIASEVGGVNLVIEHGKTGVLVPPGDPIKLGKEIINLIENPYIADAIAISARESVEASLSWKTISEQFSDIFETIFKEYRPEMDSSSVETGS
jgi:glycosyltransferase involved in cell wall biosynthesis